MADLQAILGTPSYPTGYPAPRFPSHAQAPNQADRFVPSGSPLPTVWPTDLRPSRMVADPQRQRTTPLAASVASVKKTGGNPLYAFTPPKPWAEKTDSGFLIHGMPEFPNRTEFDSDSEFDAAKKAYHETCRAALEAWEKTPEGVAWRTEKDAREARQEAREKAERERIERLEADQRAIREAQEVRLRGITQPHYDRLTAWRESNNWYKYESIYPEATGASS